MVTTKRPKKKPRSQDQCQFFACIDEPDASCDEPGTHYLVNRDADDKVVKVLEREFPDDPALDSKFAG